MTIKEYRKVANVGDKVKIELDGRDEEGLVGEIEGDYFFFWNNLLTGMDGKLDPKNYKYSRQIDFESTNKIKLLNEKKAFTQKRKAYIEIVKETGKIYLSIKMPSEVEEFFKRISEEKFKDSNAWFQKDKPAQYYSQPAELEKKLLEIDDYVYSDFGSGLLKEHQINVAVLRTVGISKGIKIHSKSFDSFTNADLQDYVKRLGIYVKRLWESNISTTRIKSVITYEI